MKNTKLVTLVATSMLIGIVFSSCGFAQSSQPSPTPTLTTPTMPSKLKIHPYYGSSIQSFLDWYGQPMDDLWKEDGVRYDFPVWSNNPYIGLIVDANGVHGHDANIVLLMAPNKVAWTLNQAAAYCNPFLPSDAKLVKKNNLIWTFNSTLIKKTVSPSGIFSITYTLWTDTSIGPAGIISCTITGGTGDE